MLKLILNENMKIYLRPINLVMLVIIALGAVFSSIIARIYNIAPNTQNLWGGVIDQTWLMFLVNIFTVVVAGGIVASEFGWGTIKLLLIRPISRNKILFSKYITVIIFSLSLVVLLFGFSFVANTFIYGFTKAGDSYLLGKAGGKAFLDNNLLGALQIYALKCAEVLIYGTLAFMLSVVSRSSAFSISLTIILIYLGPQFTELFSDYPWTKLLLFANTDLTKYIGISDTIHGMSLKLSIIILSFYFVLFNLVSWSVFNKSDVAI